MGFYGIQILKKRGEGRALPPFLEKSNFKKNLHKVKDLLILYLHANRLVPRAFSVSQKKNSTLDILFRCSSI